MSSMSTDTDKTYNGWSNYPTWCVNLWLSNDQAIYGATEEVIRDAADNARQSDYWTPEQARLYSAEDALKAFVEELAGELPASFVSDLLGYALGEINYREIATSWLEQLDDEA